MIPKKHVTKQQDSAKCDKSDQLSSNNKKAEFMRKADGFEYLAIHSMAIGRTVDVDKFRRSAKSYREAAMKIPVSEE